MTLVKMNYAGIPSFALAKVEDDRKLIEMWLHGKSGNTAAAYQKDIEGFQAFVGGKPFQQVTLNDMQDFANALSLKGYAVGTQRRKLNAVRSLLTYGHNLGVLAVNAGKPVELPKGREALAQKILSEGEILRLIHGFSGQQRDRLLLKLLYALGARVSEVCALTWADCSERADGGVTISIYGKGGKTRHVAVSGGIWDEISSLRGVEPISSPIFKSRKGNALTRQQVLRIVKKAADEAGIDKPVSPHWFRHAHASHSLERGASTALVQATLGHADPRTTMGYVHLNPEKSSGAFLAI
ncbi:MAG: tyrosine-type recombinase/integrase [Synechococcales cyanobacterium CRU_2_2]|nr:tyrosine-type recombinase/integrase [Synechococcales cyanobacterium CRU_2_2]